MTETDEAITADRLASRALEWEADVFASAATIWLTGSVRMEAGHPWIWFMPDNAAALRAFMVGAYVLFSIMDISVKLDRPPEERTHPAPMLRVSLMASALATTIHHWGALDGDAAMDVARQSIRAVEIGLNTMAGGMMEAAEATALQTEFSRSAAALEAKLVLVKTDHDRSRLQGYFWARIFDGHPEPS